MTVRMAGKRFAPLSWRSMLAIAAVFGLHYVSPPIHATEEAFTAVVLLPEAKAYRKAFATCLRPPEPPVREEGKPISKANLAALQARHQAQHDIRVRECLTPLLPETLYFPAAQVHQCIVASDVALDVFIARADFTRCALESGYPDVATGEPVTLREKLQQCFVERAEYRQQDSAWIGKKGYACFLARENGKVILNTIALP